MLCVEAACSRGSSTQLSLLAQAVWPSRQQVRLGVARYSWSWSSDAGQQRQAPPVYPARPEAVTLGPVQLIDAFRYSVRRLHALISAAVACASTSIHLPTRHPRLRCVLLRAAGCPTTRPRGRTSSRNSATSSRQWRRYSPLRSSSRPSCGGMRHVRRCGGVSACRARGWRRRQVLLPSAAWQHGSS